MKAKVLACCVIAAAMPVSPTLAANKKPMKRATQQEASMSGGIVGGAARTAGATAFATAGAIATAPFNPALMVLSHDQRPQL